MYNGGYFQGAIVSTAEDKKENFDVGDHVVCPGHGVGQVTAIEERTMGEENKSFYAVKIINNGMIMMVPVDSITGIRSLASEQQVEQMYEVLNQHDVEIDMTTWNRRYREYTNKINTGSLVEIAEVLRTLFLLKDRKTLSFGEKKLLGHCLNLLSEEVALTDGAPASQVTSKIESCFSPKI